MNHPQHHWLSPTIHVHLSAIWPDMGDKKRIVSTFHPDLQHVMRMPARPERMQQSHAALERYVRQIDQSANRMTVIDVAWRERFNRAPGPPGQFNGLTWIDPTRRLTARYSAPIVSQENTLAEVPRTALRRATRVSSLPTSTPCMEMRRPERAIGALREPLQSLEATARHQSSVGTARAAEPALPMIGVEQLAGQVLKEIDRRVTARRERLGQR
jgi:hypothetical protein